MSDEIPEVLLVEDSPDDVAFLQRTMEKAGLGARLRALPDGAAALDFIFGIAPQSRTDPIARLKLIILDLKLPKVGGLEVLHRLKENPRTRTIPVVVFSSSQEGRDLIECYRLGANSYIVKPMDFEAFVTSVRMLCQYWLQFNQTP